MRPVQENFETTWTSDYLNVVLLLIGIFYKTRYEWFNILKYINSYIKVLFYVWDLVSDPFLRSKILRYAQNSQWVQNFIFPMENMFSQFIDKFLKLLIRIIFCVRHKNRRKHNQQFKLLFFQAYLHFGTSNLLSTCRKTSLIRIISIHLVLSSLEMQRRVIQSYQVWCVARFGTI